MLNPRLSRTPLAPTANGLILIASLILTLPLAGQEVQQDVTLRVGSLEETVTVTDTRAADAGIWDTDKRREKRDASGCVSPAVGANIRPPRKVRDPWRRDIRSICAVAAWRGWLC